MQGKKRKPIKIILLSTLAVFVLFNAFLIVFYLIAGHPFFLLPGSLDINMNDPFWQTTLEYEAAVDHILKPLYLEPGPTGKISSNEEIIQYFLDNDFTDEINALDVIYQKAVRLDEEAKNQRENAKSPRVWSLRKMMESMETFAEAMEIVQKCADKDEWELTEKEKILLFDLTRRAFHNASMDDETY